MQRDIRVYLEDMQHYLGELQGMVSGKSPEDFEQSILLVRAVERVFEIVAEILRRMGSVSSETDIRIDDVGRIIAFRNLLAHEYDKVEDEKVWEITQKSLPRLVEQVNAWAAELGMEAPPERASSITAASTSIES